MPPLNDLPAIVIEKDYLGHSPIRFSATFHLGLSSIQQMISEKRIRLNIRPMIKQGGFCQFWQLRRAVARLLFFLSVRFSPALVIPAAQAGHHGFPFKLSALGQPDWERARTTQVSLVA